MAHSVPPRMLQELMTPLLGLYVVPRPKQTFHLLWSNLLLRSSAITTNNNIDINHHTRFLFRLTTTSPTIPLHRPTTTTTTICSRFRSRWSGRRQVAIAARWSLSAVLGRCRSRSFRRRVMVIIYINNAWLLLHRWAWWLEMIAVAIVDLLLPSSMTTTPMSRRLTLIIISIINNNNNNICWNSWLLLLTSIRKCRLFRLI